MAECLYDLDGPEDLRNNPEQVEFLCVEPDKPAPEVQDPLKVIDLGIKEDLRLIQLSGLLETEDRAEIVVILLEVFTNKFDGWIVETSFVECVSHQNNRFTNT